MIKTYKKIYETLNILSDELDKKSFDKQYAYDLIWRIKGIINDKIKEIQEEE